MHTIRSTPPDFADVCARVNELAARSTHLVRRISGEDWASTTADDRDICVREFIAVEEELGPLRTRLHEMVAKLQDDRPVTAVVHEPAPSGRPTPGAMLT